MFVQVQAQGNRTSASTQRGGLRNVAMEPVFGRSCDRNRRRGKAFGAVPPRTDMADEVGLKWVFGCRKAPDQWFNLRAGQTFGPRSSTATNSDASGYVRSISGQAP